MESNDKKQLIKQDSLYEGRDNYFVDEDRMINEGLAGGTVITREENKQIEEARELPLEED
jgi:hypothetical protein